MASTAGRPAIVAGLRLVALVGQGGEGEVWEARDGYGRRRALKLIRPDAFADPDAVEARAAYLRRIDHPALVRVHRSGLLGEGPLRGWGIVEMDYVDGVSLQDAPGDPDVLRLLWPLAEALDLLHAGAWSDGVPLVHRDVKPANLVYVEGRDPGRAADGRVVLVDPSTLRGVDGTQLTRVGTPLFAAPEILTGRIGPPADVYAFAATALALLTGARGARLAAMIDDRDALGLPTGLPWSLPAGLPGGLPGGLRAALSPRPGERPVSCRSLLDDTLRFASSGAGHTLLLPADAGTEAQGPLPGQAEWPLPGQAEWPLLGQATLGGMGPSGAWDGDVVEDRGIPGGLPAAPDGAPARERPRRLLPWLLCLLLLLGLPALGWAGGWLRHGDLALAVGLSAVGSLLAHAAAGRSLLLALLLPPVAWALLLADRAPGSARRRAWTAAVLCAALALVTAGAMVWVAGSWDGRLPPPTAGRQAFAVGLGLTLLGALASSLRGGWGLLVRLLLVPLWLAGTLLLLGGAVLGLPFAVALGRGRQLGRFAVGTLASVVETFRSQHPLADRRLGPA